MIRDNNKFYRYVLKHYIYEDKYNGDASSSVVGQHLGILKILLENLKLSKSEFFTTSTNAGNDFNYFIRINENNYIDIALNRDSLDTCKMSLLNFKQDDIDKVGEIVMDLKQSLTSDEIKRQFKIGIHFIETGVYSSEPVDRFTFNTGARRFGKRR